jgi:TolA-binding protein
LRTYPQVFEIFHHISGEFTMSTDQSSPSFGQQAIRVMRFLLRLLFVLIVAIGLGLGIYYAAARGIPELYKRYIQPVEDNTLRLDDLETRQAQELALLNERLSSLQSKLTDLEIQRDKDRQLITELETKALLAESTQATQTAVIATLVPQSAVIVEYQAKLDEFQSTLDMLSEKIMSNRQRVDELDSNAQSTEQILTSLQEEIHILRTMEFLTRARLFLSQSNLAQSEINILKSLEWLERLQQQLPEDRSATLERVTTYLETALSVLPEAPLTAADQLERAWQLLIQEAPEESP